MKFLPWIDEHATNISKKDEQHIKFAGFIYRLYEAILNRKRQEVISVILEGLAVYSMQQFSNEEELMLKNRYPGYEVHKDQHTALLKKMIDYKVKYKKGHDNMGLRLAEFLKMQLFGHISSSDNTFCRYLNEMEELETEIVSQKSEGNSRESEYRRQEAVRTELKISLNQSSAY
jgi:hemerythrin